MSISAPHARGRQSLPPRLEPPLTPASALGRGQAPISSSSSSSAFKQGSGGGGRGEMASSSKSISPLPTSQSMGNLNKMRGSSEDTSITNPSAVAGARGGGGGGGGPSTPNATPGGTTSQSQKKKRKKGWRGYAWVLEDDNGNVLEVRDDDREPAVENGAGRSAAERQQDHHDQVEGQDPGQEKATPLPPPVEQRTTEPSSHADSSGSPDESVVALPIEEPAAPTASASVSASASASASLPLEPAAQAESASSSKPLKRTHKSSSPSIASVAQPAQLPHGPDDEALSAAPSEQLPVPLSNLSTGTATPADPNSHPQPPKKRRKTSLPPSNTSTVAPVSSAPPLERNSSNSKASKVKVARPSPFAAPPTRSQKAFLVREAHSHASRAGSQHVVDDDTPLPVPPRTGLGEGGYETPKESALREEIVIRNEAKTMIEAAQRHRAEVEAREKSLQQQQLVNGSRDQGSLGRRARKPVNYVYDDDEDISDDDVFKNSPNHRRSARGGPGPSSSRHTANADSPYDRNHRRESGVSVRSANPDSFEAQYAQVQNAFKASAAAHRVAEADRAMAFHKIQRPALVLAPPAATRPNIRDRIERAHADGFGGLTWEMESDAQGFVDNVKENLRSILRFYFHDSPARRDAFCERIGRGLARLGWELTDNSEAAIL